MVGREHDRVASDRETFERRRAWQRAMHAAGWVGISWPKEYGGQGRSYVDKMIMLEECYKVQAPIGHHFLSDRQVGPAIMAFGSEDQKREFLPKLARGEISFCLGYSEPESGSDLVSLSTRAARGAGDRPACRG